jgi:hypothetical protein
VFHEPPLALEPLLSVNWTRLDEVEAILILVLGLLLSQPLLLVVLGLLLSQPLLLVVLGFNQLNLIGELIEA